MVFTIIPPSLNFSLAIHSFQKKIMSVLLSCPKFLELISKAFSKYSNFKSEFDVMKSKKSINLELKLNLENCRASLKNDFIISIPLSFSFNLNFL